MTGLATICCASLAILSSGFTATAQSSTEKPVEYLLLGHFSTSGDKCSPVAVTLQINAGAKGVGGFIRVQDLSTHRMSVFEPTGLDVMAGDAVGHTQCTVTAIAKGEDPAQAYTFIIITGADDVSGYFWSPDFLWAGSFLNGVTLVAL